MVSISSPTIPFYLPEDRGTVNINIRAKIGSVLGRGHDIDFLTLKRAFNKIRLEFRICLIQGLQGLRERVRNFSHTNVALIEECII
jgi:hypothetical protein